MRSTVIPSVCAAVLSIVQAAAPRRDPPGDAPRADLVIWSDRAASQWDHAHPIANGRLGGMVFGAVGRERIQLNEDSLWLGSRRDTDNPEARAALSEVRRLLFEGSPLEENESPPAPGARFLDRWRHVRRRRRPDGRASDCATCTYPRRSLLLRDLCDVRDQRAHVPRR